MGATTESVLEPWEAWPLERRKSDMRAVIHKAANDGWIGFIDPEHVARTYGVNQGEVEAEIVKLSMNQEGEGK